MAKVTTLTRKGQVTIPKAVREELGLEPFDKVEFYQTADGGIGLRKSKKLTLRDVAGSLPDLGIPIEEMLAIAREERAQRIVAKLRGEE